MYGFRAANRYAKALLEYALQQNALEAVYQDMLLIDKTVKGSKDLERMLISPINKVFTSITPEVHRLFDLLIANRRLPMLGAIAEKFIWQYNEYKHHKIAVVTTAIPLDERTQREVLQKVISLTNNSNITLENKVDANIIGGFILRVGDIQYNDSVA